MPSWDLKVVLRSLGLPPFKLLGQTELRWLSAKHFCLLEPEAPALVPRWFRGYTPTESILPAKEGAIVTTDFVGIMT